MKLLSRKQVYSGKIVGLTVDTIELGGTEYIREVVRHPGGVVVLAELQDGRIPFARQFRYPINQSLLELPAGKVDAGEEPALTAARELEEETGFRPEHLNHVLNFYVSPGYCDEIIGFYYTDRVQETAACLEHDEEIMVEFYRLEEAVELSLRGEIVDAKTLVALFWLHREKGIRGNGGTFT